MAVFFFFYPSCVANVDYQHANLFLHTVLRCQSYTNPLPSQIYIYIYIYICTEYIPYIFRRLLWLRNSFYFFWDSMYRVSTGPASWRGNGPQSNYIAKQDFFPRKETSARLLFFTGYPWMKPSNYGSFLRCSIHPIGDRFPINPFIK